MTDLSGIWKLAEAGKELVKPVYEDLAQPAVRELGRNLETATKAFRVVVSPIAALVWSYERIAPWLEDRVTRLLCERSADTVCTPDPMVFGPAVESLRYCAQVEELRELFARLLASSVDSRTAQDVHPSYTDVLRQLTCDEGRILPVLANDGTQACITPMVQQKLKKTRNLTLPLLPEWSIEPGHSFAILESSVTLKNPSHVPQYLNNLERLSIISVKRSCSANGMEFAYEQLCKHKIVLEFVKQSLEGALRHHSDGEIHYRRDLVLVTPFGEKLLQVLFPEKS